MDKDNFGVVFTSIETNLGRTIDAVIRRGYSDCPEDTDDYSLLIDKYEFKSLIVFELYENYFSPQRHEFELQILNDVVEAVIKYKALCYAVGTGVIGSGIYDLIKQSMHYIAGKFEHDKKRSSRFKSIGNDVSKVEDYFKNHKSSNIETLEKQLEIDRQKLLPLLKVLGFKVTRGKKPTWKRPEN